MLAIVGAIYTSAGVLAPWAMGKAIQGAASRLAGYEQGFVMLSALLIVGGLIGVLFIRPEADRQRLAARFGVTPDSAPSPARP